MNYGYASQMAVSRLANMVKEAELGNYPLEVLLAFATVHGFLNGPYNC